MSNYKLIIFSMIVSFFSVYLYVHRDKIDKPEKSFESRLGYMATGIQSTQTDESGQVSLSVKAKEVIHNLKTDTMVLTNVYVSKQLQPTTKKKSDINEAQNLHKHSSVHVDFTADTAIWNKSHQLFALTDNVYVTKYNKSANSDKKIEQFNTDNLSFDIKNTQLSTQSEIKYQSDSVKLSAEGLQANLETGDYHFKNLKASYQ